MQGILTNQEEKNFLNEEKFIKKKCLTLTYIWREAQIYNSKMKDERTL